MNNPNTILAVDPGLRDLGYAVLKGQVITASGVISFRLVRPTGRLAAARSAVRELVRRHHPNALVVEKTHWYPNGLHRLMATMRALARQHRLPLAVYSPQTVRKHLLGNGWAGKAEAAAAMSVRYPALRVHLTQNRKWKERYWQNMYDAVALATHHRLMSKPPSRGR